jgi:hypothetical protein
MTASKSLKALAATFFLSGIWDIIAGFVYSFQVGTIIGSKWFKGVGPREVSGMALENAICAD